MESIEYLEEKLRIAKRYEEITNILESAKCPICGNIGLTYRQNRYGDMDFGGGWKSEIRCRHCLLFHSEYEMKGMDYHNMNQCEGGELQMLEGAYNRIKNYIK